MKSKIWYCIAVGGALAGLTPSAAMAGTRAGDNKTVYPAAKAAPAASTSQGPKGGFPSTPGLEIAKIKANDHAAFKRNASNGS
ncbi:MAG: hypothetical protein C0409_01325 [Novosphingobium sp.]|nr:hypothetical protein [Novosphingobium sp.]